MQISIALVTGVVSGVLTAALVGMAVRLTNSVILPWYREITYSGVEISGEWKNEMGFEGGWSQSLRADLLQRGHFVKGTITVTKLCNGKLFQSGAVSKLTGELRDRLLTATIEPADRARLGRAVLLLEVIGDGSTMSGCVSWYDSDEGNIESKAVRWYRNGRGKLAEDESNEMSGPGETQSAGALRDEGPPAPGSSRDGAVEELSRALEVR